MPVVNSNGAVQTDAQSVASFFSETCAPRVTSDGPLRGGAAWDGLCTACQVGASWGHEPAVLQ
jgi:melanoma-associated antigen p97